VKVKSPFRNSFLKCEFKYGREDLFRVDFFKKYFIYLVEKNSILYTGFWVNGVVPWRVLQRYAEKVFSEHFITLEHFF
jgi:hypothetical protein